MTSTVPLSGIRIATLHIEDGIHRRKAKGATKNFAKLLKWIDESSQHGPSLAGSDFSLADIAATPYMVRLEILKLSRMWDHKPLCEVMGADQGAAFLQNGDHQVTMFAGCRAL